jgi:16S rRNA processing protein RimM
LNNKTGQKSESSPDPFIVLGIIVRPHGLKGEVKISLLCSGLDRLVSCPSLRLVKDGKEIKRLSVMRSFMHPDGDAILRFKEIVGVDEAESLRGAQVAVLASEKAELPPDTFYLDDLMGLREVTVAGDDLGQIEEVMDGLANGVCVVRQGEKEILIPALKSVIREVDLKARRMVVDLPEEVDGDTAD